MKADEKPKKKVMDDIQKRTDATKKRMKNVLPALLMSSLF